jgi:hypothetical protein
MYLDKEQLITALRLGRSVEQWIGVTNHPDFVILNWIRIDQEKNGTFSVSSFKVFDDGNLDLLDIYEFEPYDPDYPFAIINNFLTYQQVFSFCEETYKCRGDRYVNAGMIQEEYRQYLLKKQ